MKNLTFTISITGVISPNGGDPEASDIAMTQADLQENLSKLFNDALRNGCFTGETPACLVDHTVTITTGEEQPEGAQSNLRHEASIRKLDSFSVPVSPENLVNIKGCFDCGEIDGEGHEVLLDTTFLETKELDQLSQWVNLAADCLIEKRIIIYRSAAESTHVDQ